MREFNGLENWERKLGVFFVTLFLFVLLGPFDTYNDLSLGPRLVFWTVILVAIGFFMHFGIVYALITPRLGRLHNLLRLALGSFTAAIPSAGIVVFVHQVFQLGEIAAIALPSIWLQVGVIGVLIGFVEFLAFRRSDPTVSAPPVTAFHARLRAGLGTNLISLSMQDHYAEATTTEGRQLVLTRFADALRELDGYPGLQIHRSHWVASEHVVGLEKQRSRHMARLSDGRDLPVSAPYVDAIKSVLSGR